MNSRLDELHLHEWILLLALRDDSGTVESKAGMYSYALGGALLAELMLAGCIRVEQGKKALVDFVQRQRFDDDVLDECVERIAGAKRRRKASDWVFKFAGLKRLRHRIAGGLHRRGILHDGEDRFLLIFTRKVYPTLDPEPERELVARLSEAILGESAELDSRSAIVIALGHATGLLRAHFDKRELARGKDRLERITRGELIGGAARAAVQAAQAAALAATTAAAVAASSATR